MNLNTLLNIFYPPSCIFCGEIMDYRTEICVCEKCIAELPTLPEKHCEICSEPLDIEFGDMLCAHCQKDPYHFDGIISPYLYNKGVRESILQLKFHKHIDYAKTMAVILAGQISKEFFNHAFELIIPVPISKQRYAERQYNQCDLIAGEMSKILHIPCSNDILIKHKNIPKQSTLSAKERKANVKNAYSIKDNDKIDSKQILLIDDAATTRATLDECAKILKKNGALSVHCAVFAVSDKSTYKKMVHS